MKVKTCARCNTQKPVEQFHRDSKNKDGLASSCKECRNGARRPQKRMHRRAPALKMVPARKPREERKKAPLGSGEQAILDEARRLAIVRLVQHHRSEYDTLVYRAKMQLKYRPQKKVS